MQMVKTLVQFILMNKIVERTRIDTTFQGQKAQLSVCTDKCLTEVGKKLGF